ncbi:MAG: helix-turn-helix domain-containing protein [Clostridia bacterium]|nr:helix-turn-helix domain-containing protein [Clostridia bacterium]
MENNNETLNSRIASYRKLAGFTQAQAAQLLNMKRNTYARMEKMGRPSPEQLKQIAELYRISVAMLLYGNEIGKNFESRTDRIVLKQPNDNDIFPLTTTEINAIRLIREFDEEDSKKVIDLINSIYKEKITGSH